MRDIKFSMSHFLGPSERLNENLMKKSNETSVQTQTLLLKMLPDLFSYIRALMAQKFKSSRKEAFSREFEKILDPLIKSISIRTIIQTKKR